MTDQFDHLTAALAGRYTIERELGAGGMATVFLAEDLKHHRKVAIKVLRPELAAAIGELRFLNEIEIAANLTHPHILPVHDSGHADGMLYYVMPYVGGESLRERLVRETQLGLEETVRLGREIADGLHYAHGQGVIHRDIKPENVLLASGHAVIADFGIARAVTAAGGERLTATGFSLGTPQYMSPEQATADRDVDARSDVYALGCVIYEMLAGEPPHTGPTAQAIIAKLLTEPPVRLRTVRDSVPESLDRAVMKALAKVPSDRFETAADLGARLTLEQGVGTQDAAASTESARAVERDGTAPTPAENLKTLARLIRTRTIGFPALVILTVLVVVVAIPFWRLTQRQRARESLPRIEQLVTEGRYREAYPLAERAERRLGEDTTVARLMSVVADRISVSSEPDGADVYLQPVSIEEGKTPEAPELIGVTPIRDLRIPRADYLMRVEKAGYAAVERIASSALPRVEVFVGRSPAMELAVTLLPAGEVPDDMVFVPGGEYGLVRARQDSIPLDDFFIDRYEVRNEQYQAFVSGGGYTDPSYWKHRFVRDGAGAELSWDVAMQLFKDRTGLPGPRSWVGQQYPEGKDRHPVTDVTWYEAAAYAEFVGKSLPTVYQWEKAARDGEYTHFAGIVMPWGWVGPGETTQGRANVSGTGTQPVDGYPFGVSPFGARGMAGNVKEWVFNEIGDGRMVTGGSWEEPPYVFKSFGSVSAFFSSPTIGFRLVRNTEDAAADQGSAPIVRDEYTPSYTRIDDATFRSLLTHYRYDPWQLQPEIVETVEADGWTREKIRLPSPDDDHVLAYLYLPKSAVPPYQTMVFVPGVNAFNETVFDAAEWLMGPNIRAGRALFVVVMKGMVEREMEPGYVDPPIASVGYRDMMVLRGTELRRGIDYLETRDDIDTDRLAYVGFSWGAASRALYGAIDDRYQCAVLIGGGITPRHRNALQEASSMNFIPFYPPTLMIHGTNDEEVLYYTHALPQWNLLPEPKKSVFVEGAGHVPPLEVRVPAINEWLDERLGPVRIR